MHIQSPSWRSTTDSVTEGDSPGALITFPATEPFKEIGPWTVQLGMWVPRTTMMLNKLQNMKLQPDPKNLLLLIGAEWCHGAQLLVPPLFTSVWHPTTLTIFSKENL
jgi:hypothetical protein